MPVIGTAGHVDHGKSTLVLALTGRDPDRWEEEKRRGLTIDLGFAWAELPGGVEVGFVDVPGHERFMKNMLAGVDGIDAALFVVAADEGWMPQSEEHLAVLDLLGVAHGVVALTRRDLVDDDLAELAALEVQDRLAGTSLAGVPVVPTAAPAGGGVAEVAAALAEALGRAPAPADAGRPRMWVDRSFVVGGAGTVVTGTLTGGVLRVGDQVEVWPGARLARVRSIQSHERARDELGPGNRAALNLVGLDRRAVVRGAMVGLSGQWRETRRLLVELRTVRTLDGQLTSRGAYHVHLGAGAWPGRMRILEDGAALVSLDEPLPVAAGDRFIVRDVGRRAVVAGGVVLDPAPGRRAAALRAGLAGLRSAVAGSPDERADALLAVRGRAPLADLRADSGGGAPAGAVVVDGEAFAAHHVARLAEAAAGETAAFHDANPLRPGIPMASLASRLGVSQAQAAAIVVESSAVEETAGTVRHRDFAGGWGPDQQRAWEAARAELESAATAAPRASQLGLDPELLHALLREKRLVRIADDLVYLPEQLTAIVAQVGAMADGFTVAEFRDALGVSRRQAVPLLEWLDRTGVTARDGDVRRVRRRPPPPPGPAPAGDLPR